MSDKTELNIDAERVLFEADFTAEQKRERATEEYIFLALQRSPGGDYRTTYVHGRWQGWLAARRTAVQPAAAEPAFYVQQTELDKLANPLVAARGAFLHKKPGTTATVACYLAAPVAPADAVRDAEDLQRYREINTPEIADFIKGVEREALHQRDRWSASHDAGKAPEDWFWLLGYLGGKALHAAKTGDTDKALHHTISSAAALLNWHAAILGTHTAMRPGIEPPTDTPKEPAK